MNTLFINSLLVETSYRGALRNSTASRLPCCRGAGSRRETERSLEVGELATAGCLRGCEVSRSDGEVRRY